MHRRQLILGSAALLAAGSSAFAAPAADPKVLRIGVTAGIAAEVLEQALPFAEKLGLKIKIIEFQDYIRPNAALADGDLEANIFQTIPFFEEQTKAHNWKFTIVAKAFTLPMAFYSKKVKSFAEAPVGAKVGIPNDQAMGGRALLILAANGIIKLRDGVGLLPGPYDVIENPKKLKFVELEAAQLPRSLDDLTISAVNGNYAYLAGLNPSRDGILVESADGPYVCHIVTRTEDKDRPWVQKLIEAYHNPAVRDFINQKYKGSVIAAF